VNEIPLSDLVEAIDGRQTKTRQSQTINVRSIQIRRLVCMVEKCAEVKQTDKINFAMNYDTCVSLFDYVILATEQIFLLLRRGFVRRVGRVDGYLWKSEELENIFLITLILQSSQTTRMNT
jgi:hypothetical protein